MSYLDHLAACNNGSLAGTWPLLSADKCVGWLRPAFAMELRRFPEIFVVEVGRVTLSPTLPPGLEEKSAIIDAALEELVGEGKLPKRRGEKYAVAERWGATPEFLIERKFVSAFGVPAFGVHVNGFVRTPDGLKLWIGRRSPSKDVAPGKLDNMIAGGQPYGLGLMQNLVKEAAEEADVPEALARTAKPVGVITYLMEDGYGLKPDVMFTYDLEVPSCFVPRNTDGEIASFALVPAETVAERVKTTFDYKFNVNLVIIDFLIRHGVISPEAEPDYVEIVSRLRRPVS